VSDRSFEDATRVVLRPIGNPLPLGFLALAGGTLLLSGLQLGWLGLDDTKPVALILLAFVFPLQLVASIFGFLGRDVVAGTGMGVLAGTWLAIALVTLEGTAGSTSDALGLFLILAAAAMLVPAITAAAGKLVATAVLTTTSVRFAATGVFQLNASSTWADIAGVVGLLLCAVALYAALAMSLEDAKRATVLPTGRRSDGRDALRGGASAQASGVEHEAGVREQL
jgi:succinate-acetate transporter protein